MKYESVSGLLGRWAVQVYRPGGGMTIQLVKYVDILVFTCYLYLIRTLQYPTSQMPPKIAINATKESCTDMNIIHLHTGRLNGKL